jgi:transcriptional regulator with XRE-family HTH domain
MRLREKLFYLRKKNGLSQEALAEKLGVSRQAVSKWENGDADPEISKLKLLADYYGVTTDWLLSDQGIEEKNPKSEVSSPVISTAPSWLDSLPSTLGRFLKRYGWIAGVYLSIIGAGVAGMGLLVRFMVRRMMNPLGVQGDDFFGQDPMFNKLVSNNPVSIMGLVFIVIGFILLIGGIIITITLKRFSKKENPNTQ